MPTIDDYDFEQGAQPSNMAETSPFMAKMESARRARPCPISVDMRNKVAGICNPYQFGERTFHMDEASQAIFEQQLTKNGGVFTQGAYENIINGPHTLKAIRQIREKAEDVQSDEPEEAQIIEIIDFGFHRKRQQERYELVTHLVIFTQENSYFGITKDISENGILVLIPMNYAVKSGDKVQLSFYDQYDEYIAADELKKLYKVSYEVCRVIEKGERLSLALQRIEHDKSHTDLAYLQTVVNQKKDKLRQDTKSIMSDRSAQVFERYYADISSQIPLFYTYADGHSELSAIGCCAGNRQLHDVFLVKGTQYDYSILNDQRWLPAMIERCLARDLATSCVITLYRLEEDEKGTFRAISSDQLNSFKSLSLLWAYLSNVELLKVFRLTLNPARRIPDKRMQESLSPMLQYLPDEITSIKEDIASLKIIGTLIDISDSLNEAATLRDLRQHSSLEISLAVKQQFSTDLFEVNNPLTTQPDKVFFGYKRQRSEERYIVQMDLSLKTTTTSIKATSIDLSTRGLRIEILDGDIELISKGQDVTITFDSILNRAAVDLKEVLYRVVKVFEDKNEISLIRTPRSREDFLIDDFFNSMISRNKSVLEIEAGDVREEILSGLYEGLLVADMQSIPLFISRGDRGGAFLSSIATTVHGNGVLDYLKNNKGGVDLDFVNQPIILTKIIQMLKQSEHAHAELIVLSYRSVMSGELITVFDFDIEDKEDRWEFIRQMIRNKNYCVLLLTVSDLAYYSDEDQRRLLSPIYSQSMSYAKRLKLKLDRLYAIGELNDITREYLSALRSPMVGDNTA